MPPPVPCTDGTDHSYAVEGLVEKLRGTGIDSMVSFVITDDFYNASSLFSGFFSPDPKSQIPRDTILRRNESTVYYFGIDNKGAEPRCRRVASELNGMIEDHYGCMPSPSYRSLLPVGSFRSRAARKMAQLMLELGSEPRKTIVVDD